MNCPRFYPPNTDSLGNVADADQTNVVPRRHSVDGRVTHSLKSTIIDANFVGGCGQQRNEPHVCLEETLSALVAYVRSLTYPKNWQLDDDAPTPATTDAVKRGFALFTSDAGCNGCHVHPSLDKPNPEDIGTGGRFKVPSLRAVASTAPYFHDGRTASLRDAVKFMWNFYARKMDTGHMPTDAELDDLLAYVSAL
ncbi:MAG TPA: c-type cytochrome [Bradyrhizobium sp.]|nr:c-type cytochrome [Bradyrhizobium sp.]